MRGKLILTNGISEAMSHVDIPEGNDPFRAVVAALERFKTAVVDETDDARLVEIAEELWDVVAAAEAVLEAIDFEELPDTVSLEALPDAVDIENVPNAVAAGDAGGAIDLSKLAEAIELRELWEAVDLVALRRAERDLELELADVVNTDGIDTGDDGESGGLSGMIGGDTHVGFDATARQEAIQRSIETAVEAFRNVLFETHDTLRVLYESNQASFGPPGRRGASDSAVRSTLPKGPLADSASTRYSSVPAQVRHSRTKNPRRIYGRRFETAGRNSWR